MHRGGELDFAAQRLRMVDLIAARGVRSAAVLAAMRRLPRERFVSAGFEKFAYEDGPLPIGAGQTISQPYIVALMLEAAELGLRDKVLEVGAGSGYAAALAGMIVREVVAIERHAVLVESAKKRLKLLRIANVDVRAGDGTRGLAEEAPFDAILVAAGGPQVPESLKLQLAIGGRLVIPVGDESQRQSLRKLTRRSKIHFEEEDLGGVMFVPLIGEEGWTEDAPRSPQS